MKLLILGGTRFVGRGIVESALAGGHEVTLFNRGRTEPGAFPNVETLHGDRGGDLSALSGRRWNAVIDTSGYVHRHVLAAARMLANVVDHYTFVSTISVYADFSQRGITEQSPLKPADEESETVTGDTYGPMKVACERALESTIPERHLIIRPGIIVGPHDYTDRFPYWCRRIAAGGEVLAPGDPERPVQWIDARDLAEWIVQMTVARDTGTFNATGPAAPTTLHGMLEGIRAATERDARFTWVPDEFLRRHGSDPDRDFPFWVPEEEAGVFTVDNRRARGAGLSLRPLAETARDTLAWDAARPSSERKAGIPREREQELLRAWHRQG